MNNFFDFVSDYILKRGMSDEIISELQNLKDLPSISKDQFEDPSTLSEAAKSYDFAVRHSEGRNVRKTVRNLSTAELENLRNAFSRMMNKNDNRGYKYFAGIHGIPRFKRKHVDSRLFLPWHRAYIYFFELYLQDAQQDSTITVPWWDWTTDSSRFEGIPKTFSDEIVDGKANPLHSFHVALPDQVNLRSFINLTKCPKLKEYVTHRQPGSPADLPTREECRLVLSLTDYSDFSDRLEDLNNRVHIWIGGECGDMSYVPFASYDPIFWPHHVMIDRIFWMWQLRPSNSLPADLYDEVLDPFKLTVREVLNIYQLGYDYASLQLLVEG